MQKLNLTKKQILDFGALTGMIYAVVGGVIYMVIKIIELGLRTSYDFMLSTMKYNIGSFVEGLIVVVPAGFAGLFVAHLTWRDVNKGSFHIQRSTKKGAIVGMFAGIIFLIAASIYSFGRINIISFFMEISINFCLWLIGGSLLGLRISKYVEANLLGDR